MAPSESNRNLVKMKRSQQHIHSVWLNCNDFAFISTNYRGGIGRNIVNDCVDVQNGADFAILIIIRMMYGIL